MVSEISRKNVRLKFEALVYNILIFALKTFVKDGGNITTCVIGTNCKLNWLKTT